MFFIPWMMPAYSLQHSSRDISGSFPRPETEEVYLLCASFTYHYCSALQSRDVYTLVFVIISGSSMLGTVCVCVCERERESARAH